jgi:hypothetical protein
MTARSGHPKNEGKGGSMLQTTRQVAVRMVIPTIMASSFLLRLFPSGGAFQEDPGRHREIARLQEVHSFESLNRVMVFLRDEAVRNEAAEAAVALAEAVYLKNPGMTRLILEDLAGASPGPAVRNRADDLLRRIASLESQRPPFPSFRVHVLNADSPFEAAAVVDVNNDGKADIFCGGFWYEAPEWSRRFVRELPEIDGYHPDFGAVVWDVDGDGWDDVVSGSWHGRDLFWIRNPGSGGGPFGVETIDQPGNLETVLPVDIDGDGRIDLLPNTVRSLVWYRNRRSARNPSATEWDRRDLPWGEAGHGLGAGDVNGDGRIDVVVPAGWLEQPDSEGEPWVWHPDFDLGSASVPILVHDVDNDGDADLIWGNGHGYGLYWLENRGVVDGRIQWVRHLIDDTWSQPHFLLLADLNRDGTPEVVTGKRYYAHNGNDPGADHPLCVYAYSFDRAARRWTRHVVHEGGRVGFGIFTVAADVDGDGDIDIVAPGKSGLYLLENLLRH